MYPPGSWGTLGTMISARKPLKVASARRMTAESQQPPQRFANKEVGVEHKEKEKKEKGSHTPYASELDADFYRTAFEAYFVSVRCKRNGGGREMGAASTECGNLTLGIKHCNWIDKVVYQGHASPRKFGNETLMYLASRDGFFNHVFHRLCDLKGPTVTIVATADGRIFGGYASTPWQAGTTGKYADDPAAFLFSLTDGHGGQPIMLRQSSASPKDSVFHDPDLGPCWGRALGLQLDILAYSSSDFAGDAKYRMPKDVNSKNFLAGSYNGWDVQEVGVWLV